MKRLILVATVVLQECCFGCAYRIHTATESEIYRLLGHPAIQPLTKLAQQIHLLDVAAPCLVRSAQEEPEVLEAVQALRERSGLLKPIIKNIVLIIGKPETGGKAGEEHARLLKESAERVHQSVAQLGAEAAQLLSLEPGDCPEVPGLNIGEALAVAAQEAKALHKRPPHQSIGHGLAEGFILYEFIPHSEALFSISEGLKEVQAPAPHTAKADALTAFSRIWNEVHNRVLAAGTSLLQKVRRARKDVSKPSVAVEALELAALAKYAQKDVAKKLQRVDTARVSNRLQNVENFLLKYADKTSLDRRQSRSRDPQQPPTSLSEAMQLAFEVETILPHFQYLHSDLETTGNKLRYHTHRFQQAVEKAKAGLESNNAIREEVESLQTQVEGLLRRVRSHAAASLGLPRMQEETNEPLDLMAPLYRFQQLLEFTEEKGKNERFHNEITHIRHILRKLHQEAERVYTDIIQ